MCGRPVKEQYMMPVMTSSIAAVGAGVLVLVLVDAVRQVVPIQVEKNTVVVTVFSDMSVYTVVIVRMMVRTMVIFASPSEVVVRDDVAGSVVGGVRTCVESAWCVNYPSIFIYTELTWKRSKNDIPTFTSTSIKLTWW
jgi:hypothetical protein